MSILDFTGYEVLLNEDLVIDASKSFISNIQDERLNKNGLLFSWECPGNFTSFCEGNTKKTVEITFSQFESMTNITYNVNHTFTVHIQRISSDGGDEPIFTTSINIKWVEVAKPLFTLVSLESLVLAGQDNEFEILMKNYVATNPNLKYTWISTPDSNSPATLSEFSTD